LVITDRTRIDGLLARILRLAAPVGSELAEENLTRIPPS
jgi:hypothetical protein